MAKLIKKWFENFLVSNLDDVEILAEQDEDLLNFDSTSSKYKNQNISSIKKNFKDEYTGDVIIPSGKSTLMIDPSFEGLIVEGHLEVI